MNMCCIKNKLEIPPKKGIPVETSTSSMDPSQMALRKPLKSVKTSWMRMLNGDVFENLIL